MITTMTQWHISYMSGVYTWTRQTYDRHYIIWARVNDKTFAWTVERVDGKRIEDDVLLASGTAESVGEAKAQAERAMEDGR